MKHSDNLAGMVIREDAERQVEATQESGSKTHAVSRLDQRAIDITRQ
jgi:hypothetical protein